MRKDLIPKRPVMNNKWQLGIALSIFLDYIEFYFFCCNPQSCTCPCGKATIGAVIAIKNLKSVAPAHRFFLSNSNDVLEEHSMEPHLVCVCFFSVNGYLGLVLVKLN